MNAQREITHDEVWSASDPASARRSARSLLEAHGVDGATADDACLLVSELVTNALLHGAGTPRLRVSLGPMALTVAVTDSSAAMPAPRLLPDETGGLGLAIVDQLASQWGVDAFAGGKTVWAVMPRP